MPVIAVPRADVSTRGSSKMVLKLGKNGDDLEQVAFVTGDDPEYSKMVNDIESDDEVKGGFKNLNMMFKMESEGNPLKDRKDKKDAKEKKGKTEKTIVNGKEYSKMVNEEDSDSESEDKDEEDGEEEEEEGEEGEETKVEIPDQGCFACDPQSRNLTLGCGFAVMCANVVIMLQFVANIDDWKFSPTSEFTKGYLRTFMACCSLIRAIHIITLLNLTATVKRNAIYIYPALPRQHKILLNMSLMLHVMDLMALYIGGDGLNTWAEIAITSITSISTLHCILMCWYQHTNGSMSLCCRRRVLGEEAATYVVGSGPMAISETNKGVINPNVQVDLDTFSIV